MDETDDFIDEPEIDSPALEQAQLWSGFGDDVAQRFLRLRGIVDEQMQEEALERHARRQALPRVPAAITFAVRSAIHTASQGARMHSPPERVLASSAAR